MCQAAFVAATTRHLPFREFADPVPCLAMAEIASTVFSQPMDTKSLGINVSY